LNTKKQFSFIENSVDYRLCDPDFSSFAGETSESIVRMIFVAEQLHGACFRLAAFLIFGGAGSGSYAKHPFAFLTPLAGTCSHADRLLDYIP
jgi:hypothetical protein